MKKVNDYLIIQQNSPEDLEREVRETFTQGFVPIGGVCVIVHQSGKVEYFQAIIKYEA